MSERTISRARPAAALIAALGILAPGIPAVAGAQEGETLDIGWFSRHVDPRNDAEFLALEVDGAEDTLWLLAQRYRGARGEGEPFHELWRFEAGERRRVYPISARQVAPYSSFATLRRLDDGAVAVGFLSPDAEPLLFKLDAGAAAPRAWAAGEALRQWVPLAALTVHPDGDLIGASTGGLSTVARFDPKGNERWRHTFRGTGGDLAQVLELAIVGPDVVALGLRVPPDDAGGSRRNYEAALIVLDAAGQASLPTALPELPARLIAGPPGEVAVAMGDFRPGIAVPVAAFRPPAPDAEEPALTKKSTADVLPTQERRNRRLAVARVCGNLYAYADEEKATENDGKLIRLDLVGEGGEVLTKRLTGSRPEDRVSPPGSPQGDPMILSRIDLVPHGETLYVAATIVQVLETRQVRSGIDIYRLNLGDVCGRGAAAARGPV